MVKVEETVSDEAHEDRWGVRSIDKVQRTAAYFIAYLLSVL